jgi:hypothetical protein
MPGEPRTLGALGKMLYDSKMMKSFPQPLALIETPSLQDAPAPAPRPGAVPIRLTADCDC